MRKVIDLQNRLFTESISAIQFDLKSRDEIPKLLIGLQHIHNTPAIRDEVLKILTGIIPENINRDTGRRGMDLWKVLVLGTLRLNCNWDYDKVQEIANEHRKVRQMMGHEENEFLKRYGLQTIKDNVSLLTPEILNRINDSVVRYGQSLLGKKSEKLHAACDSFVVETDVHFPTDINLLFDAIRKVITTIAAVCDILGITEWRQHDHNLKTIKKLFNRARRLKPSTAKDEKKKTLRSEIIKAAYLNYTDTVNSFLRRTEQCIKTIRELHLDIEVFGFLMVTENYISHADRQIDQVRRRVTEGEKIPHDEKVFSVFEEHTEWICKGKAGVGQELGLRVCIVKDQFGFILHHQVMEKVTDDKIAVSIITETKKKFENLTGCSFDRGFYTPENKRKLKKILDNVVLPKKGKLSEKEKEEEYSPEFTESRRKHPAVESSINALENHALDRCPDHGIHGFKRYVSMSILARNIQIVGHIIQQKKLKKQKRREQRLVA